MTPESKIPRTDAAKEFIHGRGMTEWVPAEVSLQIETELASVRAELDEMTAMHNASCNAARENWQQVETLGAELAAITKRVCQTCKGWGVIGGHTGQTPETFDHYDMDCPVCSPSGLARQLAASHARELNFRILLKFAHDAMLNWFSSEYASRPETQKITSALTLPPPPVVPLALAQRLVDALGLSSDEHRDWDIPVGVYNIMRTALAEYESWRAAQ